MFIAIINLHGTVVICRSLLGYFLTLSSPLTWIRHHRYEYGKKGVQNR